MIKKKDRSPQQSADDVMFIHGGGVQGLAAQDLVRHGSHRPQVQRLCRKHLLHLHFNLDVGSITHINSLTVLPLYPPLSVSTTWIRTDSHDPGLAFELSSPSSSGRSASLASFM